MSDEEDESISEGFSASEDEWRPGKHTHDDGASSDDDDSDFEDSPEKGMSTSGGKSQSLPRKRETGKSLLRGCADGGGVAKKRKPMGQTLRAKLYNKYRPPPKTFPNSNSGNNSPTASTSRTASKNELTPNEVGYIDSDDDGSSSESSVANHLVNPAELDLRSSFFNTEIAKTSKSNEPPIFDCNAGIDEQLSDSEADDDNNENSNKAFDFRNLLEKANSLERAKEQIEKRAAKTSNKSTTKSSKSKDNALDDVTTLLALGENQNLKHDMGAEEDDEDDDDDADGSVDKRAPSKLSKTKSTRIKRHTKTRPTSQIITASGGGGGRGAAGETDDSDWEEVADEAAYHRSLADDENLQIVIETGTRKITKESKTQHDLELALKRRLNRDLKEQQLLKHKTSLLCLFGRSYHYNRLLNDLILMQEALKLLPGTKAYPRETGPDLKYFQSFTTWFKTVVKLKSPNLYPEDGKLRKTAEDAKTKLIEQIKKKEANSKQDMLFIYITLLRGMGMQSRLVVNLQPLPLKPSQDDLLPIKLKADDEKDTKNKKLSTEIKPKTEKSKDELIKTNVKKLNTSKENTSFEKVYDKKSSNKEKSNTKSEKPKELEEKKDRNKNKKMEKPKEAEEKTERETRTKRSNRKPDNKTDEPNEGNKQEERQKNKNTLSQKLDKNEGKAQNDKGKDKEKTDKNSTKEKSETAEKYKQKNKDVEDVKAKPKENVDLKTKSSSSSSRKKPTLSKLKRPVDEPIPEIVEPKKSKNDNEQKNDINLMSNELASAGDSGIQLEASSKDNSHSDDIATLPDIKMENLTDNKASAKAKATVCPTIQRTTRSRSRSISPRPLISTEFLKTGTLKNKLSPEPEAKLTKKPNARATKTKEKPKTDEVKASTELTKTTKAGRVLRSRQNSNTNTVKNKLTIPQMDGADDDPELMMAARKTAKKRPQLEKLKSQNKSRNRDENSDSDFEPSPPKHIKRAPVLPKAIEKLRKDRRVLSTDNETETEPSNAKKAQASDMWAEVWSDGENQWICVDIFKGKLHSVDAIRKSASSNLAYIYAFQNDLSLKDVTARYCANWATIVRKNRVERAWLETAISPYYGQRTERDIREDEEMRQIHESKPLPTSICDFKDHPLYALERHLLKFQAIYPPNAPALGRTKTNEPIFSRDCVHLLHSREIWLKQARTVKLGEQPYKIVKARPKWDRLTQTVIKDLPLEIFGYWQTEQYEPPTAENGIVPRNAYGNVELFKECMLPKKTVHLRLSGLNRICKKLNIDCANAVVGFDFHQGACHPTFDGFVVCEEFADEVTAAWYQDQEDQEVKEREKYQARVYGNWKKLIKGLLIRERLKKKYNF